MDEYEYVYQKGDRFETVLCQVRNYVTYRSHLVKYSLVLSPYKTVNCQCNY